MGGETALLIVSLVSPRALFASMQLFAVVPERGQL